MSHREMVVLADADNTLWDTDAVFREAQLLLLSRLEAARGVSCPENDRLGFVRTYDQALAQSHHLHLRYPPQLLVRCLEAGLSGIRAKAAAMDAISGRRLVGDPLDEAGVTAIVADYLAALLQTPALLPGVGEGLRAAKTAGLQLYVMTEGRIEKQRQILDHHGLQTFFQGVWALTKDRAQFGRVRTKFNSCHVVIIGDQPDRDIVPAKAAGCSTVLIPSRFKPSWHSPDDYGAADYVAADFNDAIEWCAKAAAEGPLSR